MTRVLRVDTLNLFHSSGLLLALVSHPEQNGRLQNQAQPSERPA